MVPASAFRKRWFFTFAGHSSELTFGSSSLRRQPYSVSIPTTRSIASNYASNRNLAKRKSNLPPAFILSLRNGERLVPVSPSQYDAHVLTVLTNWQPV